MRIVLLVLVPLIVSESCNEGGPYHSIFFLSTLGDYGSILHDPFETICVCRDTACKHITEQKQNFNTSTIYRVSSLEDVYGFITDEEFHALRDDLLGIEYVVPTVTMNGAESVLGFGNPTNTTITINIEYPKRNNFSVKLCRNKTKEVILNSYETREIIYDCHITGTYINASDKIIVYGASKLMDHYMIEQLIPIHLWGTFYMVVPYADNPTGDEIVILTAHDNTTVHILGYDHVTIPNKYDAIQRRIFSKSPVTIKSSKQVSVTQFMKNSNDDKIMVNIIPVKYIMDKDNISHSMNEQFFYMNKWNTSSKGYPPIFSNYYAFTKMGISDIPNSLLGCTYIGNSSASFWGSNCGYMNNSKTEPEWPLMLPGDGIDNDQDGQIDEDDCSETMLTDSTRNLPGFSPSFVLISKKIKKRGRPSDFIDENILTKILNSAPTTYVDSTNSDEANIRKIWNASEGTKDCRGTTDIPITQGNLFIFPTAENSSSLKCFPGTNQTMTLIYPSTKNLYEEKLIRNIQANKPIVIKTLISSRTSLKCWYKCYNTWCSNKFIVPSVALLQSQYIVAIPNSPLLQDNGIIECVVVTIFDNTSFAIPQLNYSKENVPRLHQTTVSAFNFEQKGPVFITASHVISVQCYRRNGSDYFILSLLPAEGMEYSLTKSEKFNEELFIMATDDNTVLNVTSMDSERYTKHFLLKTGGKLTRFEWSNTNSSLSITANKSIIVLAYIMINNSLRIVPKLEPYGANLVYVPVASRSPINLSNWPLRRNINISKRKFPTITYQIPGDGIDNDQDGLTDEEYCGFLWNDNDITDIDLDGSVNEDCKGCRAGEKLLPLFVCEECDFGTFRENSSRIDECISCNDSFTTFYRGSIVSEDCVPICTEGMEFDNNSKCEPCAVGFYKNVSANDTEREVSERFWCTPCPTKFTTYEKGSTNCIEICGEGKELDTNTSCRSCVIGYYKDISSANVSAPNEKRWNCTACAQNMTTMYTGSMNESACITICSEGMQLNNATKECELCPVGYYKNLTAVDTDLDVAGRFWCKKCPKGLTTYTVGTSSVKNCIAHCEERMFWNGSLCLPCPTGFYKNTSSKDPELPLHLRWNCSECEQGKTSFTNGNINDTCIDICKEGEELNNNTLQCEPCHVGFYKNLSANDTFLDDKDRFWCKSCPLEQTTYGRGATGCIDVCGEGKELGPHNGCRECPVGQYKNISSANTTAPNEKRWNCTACEINRTTLFTGSLSEDKCILICTEGMQLDNISMECESCPVGKYKNLSAVDTSLSLADRFYCKQCPRNLTTYTIETTAEENCIAHCEERKFLNGSVCSWCPIGSYKNTSSEDPKLPAHLRWNCTKCDQNKTSLSNENSDFTCVDICTEGTELNNETLMCEPCAVGFYKNLSASDTSLTDDERFWCKKCPADYTTYSKGSFQCIGHCKEGMYLNGSSCFPCPVGSYKKDSSEKTTLSLDLRWNCRQCPTNFTTFSNGTINDTCIEHCVEGQYLLNGTCLPCQIGFYKNTSSNNISLHEDLRWNCTRCPKGYTTLSTGSSNCTKLCKKGEEFNGTTGLCQPCAVGFYKNISGNQLSCYQCPENHTTRATGKSSLKDCKRAKCQCPCDRVHKIKNYTSEELGEVIEQMKKELTVNREQLSNNVRKRISIMDRRPSATSLGSIGIVIITFIFAVLIAFDIVTLKEHISMFFHSIVECFQRN